MAKTKTPKHPKEFIKMKSATWLKATGDGVIYGYGVIDNQWLNFHHKHGEKTPQNAIITHWPKEYVEYYYKTNKLKDIGANLGKAGDEIKKALLQLLKEEAAKKKAAEDAAKKKNAKDSSAMAAQSDITTMDAGIISGAVLAAVIGIGWEIVKGFFSTGAALLEQADHLHSNADGSYTFVTADYYSGTAKIINHCGWFGMGNHINEVRNRSLEMKRIAKSHKVSSYTRNAQFTNRIVLRKRGMHRMEISTIETASTDITIDQKMADLIKASGHDRPTNNNPSITHVDYISFIENTIDWQNIDVHARSCNLPSHVKDRIDQYHTKLEGLQTKYLNLWSQVNVPSGYFDADEAAERFVTLIAAVASGAPVAAVIMAFYYLVVDSIDAWEDQWVRFEMKDLAGELNAINDFFENMEDRFPNCFN